MSYEYRRVPLECFTGTHRRESSRVSDLPGPLRTKKGGPGLLFRETPDFSFGRWRGRVSRMSVVVSSRYTDAILGTSSFPSCLLCNVTTQVSKLPKGDVCHPR